MSGGAVTALPPPAPETSAIRKASFPVAILTAMQGACPRYIRKKTIRKKIKVIVFLLMWRAVTLFPPSFVDNYLLSGKQAFRLQLIADLTGAFGYLLGTKIP